MIRKKGLWYPSNEKGWQMQETSGDGEDAHASIGHGSVASSSTKLTPQFHQILKALQVRYSRHCRSVWGLRRNAISIQVVFPFLIKKREKKIFPVFPHAPYVNRSDFKRCTLYKHLTICRGSLECTSDTYFSCNLQVTRFVLITSSLHFTLTDTLLLHHLFALHCPLTLSLFTNALPYEYLTVKCSFPSVYLTHLLRGRHLLKNKLV
jgi:hypothetical protein